MELRDSDRLILGLLLDIHKHLKIDGDINADFVADAVYGGHYWALRWEMPGLFHDHSDPPKEVTETVDILDMWMFIEEGFEKLDNTEKARVQTEANMKHVRFVGFDGNHDNHFGIANFLVNKMGRFSNFKDRSLNSHSRTLPGYLRMLEAFKEMRPELGFLNPLSADQIITLLKAQYHPSHRSEEP